MTSPLHAAHSADKALQDAVEVVENVRLARDTFRLRFEFPELARRILPGQFLMVRLGGVNDPLLGRPLAMYGVSSTSRAAATAVDVVYLVKGKFTTRLSSYRPGQRVEVWGPLGNGFDPRPAEHLIMVAGGIGQTPFVALAKERLGLQRFGEPAREAAPCQRVSLCYGARSADLLAGVEDFERVGVEVHIATEDGSRGRSGRVTDLLRELLGQPASPGTRRIVCCGPEPMMEAVAAIAAETQTPCQVSLETPMACGVGICFTCVARIRDEAGGWDYRRTCVEGPVFDAEQIEW